MKSQSRMLMAAVLTAIVIGSCLGFWMMLTRGRVAVALDSVSYLYAGQTFAEGRGLLNFTDDGVDAPMTHFPPVLPILLSRSSMFGTDVLTFDKFMNRFLCVSSLLVLVLIIYRQTQSLGTSLAAAAMVGLNWTVLLIHTFVYSEPLFLLFSLLCIYCLTIYASSSRFWLLAAAGVFATLAVMSRYVGLCLLPVGVLVCLMQSRQGLRRGLATLIFLATSCAGSLVWFVRNRLVTGNAADRHLVLHLPGNSQLMDLVHTIAAMLPIPGRSAVVGGVALGLLILALLAGLFSLLMNGRAVIIAYARQRPVTSILLMVALSYSFLLLISISLVDADTPLNERILAPELVFLWGFLILLAWGALKDWGIMKNQRTKMIVCLVVCLIVLGNAVKSYHRIGDMHYQLADKSWSQSQTLIACRAVAPEDVVYTNRKDIVWFLTGRVSCSVPVKFDRTTRAREAGYGEKIEAMCRRVEEGPGVVVFFDGISYGTYMPSREDLEHRLGSLENRYPDGAVFSAQNRH